MFLEAIHIILPVFITIAAIIAILLKDLIASVIALAAMIFGKWKPQGALLACLLFGGAQGIAVFLGQFNFRISSQLISMLPYVITIVVLIGFVGKSAAPSADGIPYEKEHKF